MKNPAQQALRTALALLAVGALSALGLLAVSGTGWSDEPARLHAYVLFVVPVVAAFATVFLRMVNEDRITRLEAALCRERNARSQADQALAEADLLLARLASRSRAHRVDPTHQMTAIQADLAQLQRQVAAEQPQLAWRLEQLCRRLERATAGLRNLPRAAESG